MKIRIIGLLTLLMLGCSGMVMGQAISVDHVDGVTVEGDSLLMATGETITFYIRMEAGPVGNKGMTGAFRVYSDDGATWVNTVLETTDAIGEDEYDFFWKILPPRSVDGAFADTVGFAGAVMDSLVGMRAGFDDITHTITIGPIDLSHEGEHICLDSCFYPPGSNWMWELVGSAQAYPDWDGPHCYIIDADGTDVHRLGDMMPTEWSVGQNYPNPFNPTTQIAFDVPSRSHVTLAVYNVLGQHVIDLADEVFAPGHYTADWDGTTQGGNSVASGVYFYRLETENYIETKKMMLLK
jgi:hypothetical protein